jgi:DNA-binding response OmpR family regulator
MLHIAGAGSTAPTILVVDHDSSSRLFCEAALRVQGFRTVEAHNGPQSSDKALSEPPALVVLDVRVRGLEGFDLIAQLRATDATRNIPILAVTSDSVPDLSTRLRAAGADALLLKPLTPEALASTVALLLRRAALLRSMSESDTGEPARAPRIQPKALPNE